MSKPERDKLPHVEIEKLETWSAAELGRILGNFSRTWIMDRVRSGELPLPVIIGTCKRFRAAEIRDWLAARCPPQSHWVWEPSEFMPLAQAVRLKRLELAELERQIELRRSAQSE